MPLDPATFLALAAACAPAVAPTTLLAVARVESGLDPLAIGVNGAAPRAIRPRTPDEAARRAEALIAEGRNVDLGLSQINVRNLGRLGLTVRQAFDPCRNLAAAGQVLREGYVRAKADAPSGQAALRIALSYYNTGGADRGFRNGYVTRVLAAAGAPAPAPPPSFRQVPPPPAWDVFTRSASPTPRMLISMQGAAP